MAAAGTHHDSFQPNRPKKRNNNQVIQAEVIEIDETTTPRASKLDRFREAYGSYFASSAQRSAQRFGDSFKRAPAAAGDSDEGDDFDQVIRRLEEGLASEVTGLGRRPTGPNKRAARWLGFDR